MATTSVEREWCELRHAQLDRTIAQDEKLLRAHDARLVELEKGNTLQANINALLQKQVEQMEARVRALETKPQKRLDRVLDEVVRWATLLVVGLLAAKVGL